MTRSYFSRLVRGGESAPLAPPRPISNLWKTAQIDAASAAPDAPPLAAGPRSAVQRGRAAASDSQQNPAEAASRSPLELDPAMPLQSSSRKSSTTRKSEIPLEAGTARRDGGRRPIIQAAKSAPPALAATPPAPSLSARSESPSRAARPALPSHPVEAKSVQPEARPPVGVEPVPLTAQRRAKDPDPAFPAPLLIAAAAPPAPRSPARLQLMESPAPGNRESSRRARQGSNHEETHEKTSTVQIGKIEVQVLPPPLPSYRQALPPAPPKGRLARGYALWPGW